jgi:protease I
MAASLSGRHVAILATNGVEEVELQEPRRALQQAGASTAIVSLAPGTIQSMHRDVEPGERIAVDLTVDAAKPGAFDALVLPGGTTNPDTLRIHPSAVAFVRHFLEQGKPVAAICHGPWTLLEAGGVKGRHVTSWPSLKTDLLNAGAEWTDQPVVVDGPIITSRKPEDLPDFCREMLRVFANP